MKWMRFFLLGTLFICTYTAPTFPRAGSTGRKLASSYRSWNERNNAYNTSSAADRLVRTLWATSTTSLQSWKPVGGASSSINEGCVAIEHLEGYVLQHRNHLRRRVLCSQGFCATPNHAIIVDGVLTSMERLCTGTSRTMWECECAFKLVNNLKISANRRVVVSEHIIVTPYDVRFPKAASWATQIAEDIFNLVSNAIAFGTVIALTAFMVKPIRKGSVK